MDSTSGIVGIIKPLDIRRPFRVIMPRFRRAVNEDVVVVVEDEGLATAQGILDERVISGGLSG